MMADDVQSVDIGDAVSGYLADVDAEFAERMDAWPPDFTHIQVHEVVGGLLARQATLTKEIASAPSIWNGHSAPILLRAMADVYINLAWLLLDPPERCLRYISFGLGQSKLELEHRKAEIGTRTPTPQESEMLEAREAWIDSQRATFLQDVDLGKWSGLSVRQMAEEADCLDFYNYVYSPFSGCAHSMWQHVASYNLTICENALHRHHRLPHSSEIYPDLDYLFLSAKYWIKSVRAFDDNLKLTITKPKSRQRLMDTISRLPPRSSADRETEEGLR